MQTDDNSVCSLTCVDSLVLTKSKHCYKSISPKGTEYRGNAHLLSKLRQLTSSHFRVWFNIHECPRRWQFWLMLKSSLASTCLGKVLPEMLYSLWKKFAVNTVLPNTGCSVSHQMDLWKAFTCSPSQSRICHYGCFRYLPSLKAQMKTFVSLVRVINWKAEEWVGCKV